jgi:putative aldouronate transport system substrate-binding protein
MRKIVSMLLIFTLIFIAACSSQPESSGNDSSSNSPSTSTPEKKAEKPAETPTIEFFVNEHPSWPTNRDHLVWKQMEEGGGMKLDLKIAADPYVESLNLAIASGTLPDIMLMPNYQLGNKYGSEGALINILDHLDKMPNLKKWMAKYPEHTQMALSYDGKMYVAPNEGIGETNRMLWLYRKDIFTKHGLETPNNYEELYQVLKKLKTLYPDSYPFGIRGKMGKLRNLAANFQTASEYYYDFDKKEWRYGPIEDNYKVMVEYMNRFYKEGLIPPDWLSIETGPWQQLISSSKSFVTQDYIGRIDMFNIPMRKDNPEFTLAHMPPPAGFVGGKQEDYSAHYLQSGYSIAINTDQLDTALKYIDWTFSEEGRDSLSWGNVGETYTVENGKKVFKPEYDSTDTLRSKTGLSLFGTYSWFDYDAHMSLFTDEVKDAYVADRKYDTPFIPNPPFTEEEQEKLSIQGEAITKHRDEEIAKFILGKRNLNEWDQYIKEMKNLGLDQMVNMYAEAHKRVLNAKLD